MGRKKQRGRSRAPFVRSKSSYLFFFFAAFFAVLAFFLVAIASILPSIFYGSLRHHIIAICSLYIVIGKNSQEKNARQDVDLSGVRECRTRPCRKNFSRCILRDRLVNFSYA